MKVTHRPVLLLLVLIALLISVTAFAADKDPVTVAGILEKAKCALSADQAKELKALDFEAGREAFTTLNELFNEKQTDALKKALGVREGRNDRPDRPRYLMQVVMFEKAGCPLTEGQLAKLMKLPNERGSFEQAREIYTEEQNKEMGDRFQGRGGGGGRGNN